MIPSRLLSRAELHDRTLHCLLPIDRIVAIRERLEPHERVEPDPVDASLARLHLPLVRRRGETWVLRGPSAGNRPDPVLVRALRSAHALLHQDDAGLPVLDHSDRIRHIAAASSAWPFWRRRSRERLLKVANPQCLTLAQLLKGPIPLDWSQQAARFPNCGIAGIGISTHPPLTRLRARQP